MNNKELSEICPKIFILHGATCVGKSHINRRVKDLFLNFNTIESESKIYYQEVSANDKLIEYKKELSKVINEIGKANGLNFLNKFEPGQFLCIVDFIKKVIISHNINCPSSFTCSRLPMPDSSSVWFYEYIAKLCNVEIIHILVKCKNLKKYQKHLKKKNRHDCAGTAEYISNYNERLKNSEFYNHIINSPREYIRILDSYNIKRTGIVSFMFYSISGIIDLKLQYYKKRYYASPITGNIYLKLKGYKKRCKRIIKSLID